MSQLAIAIAVAVAFDSRLQQCLDALIRHLLTGRCLAAARGRSPAVTAYPRAVRGAAAIVVGGRRDTPTMRSTKATGAPRRTHLRAIANRRSNVDAPFSSRSFKIAFSSSFRLGASSDARFHAEVLAPHADRQRSVAVSSSAEKLPDPLFVLPKPFGNHRGMNVVSPRRRYCCRFRWPLGQLES